MIKRWCDALAAGCVMLLLLPVLVVVAFLVRWRLGSPVFFLQLRAGLRDKPFQLVKFRTMTNTRDSEGVLLPDQARLTPVGRFLRASSLDELPELWNVVKGEMSLVGPRPLLMEYLPLYSRDQARRHEVRPGLTGWAQVNGRNELPWDKRFALDVWYVDHQSFWLDMRILVITAWRVIWRTGISQPGDATMPKFTGSER